MGRRSMRRVAVQLPRVARLAEKEQEQAVEAILLGVWNLKLGSEPVDVSRPSPYLEHYRQIRAIINSSQLRFRTREEVIELVSLVKTHHQRSLRSIKDEIKASRPRWIVQQNDDATAAKAVDVTLRLWLMIESQAVLNSADDTLSIREVVAQSFKKSLVPTAAKLIEELSSDFSATNLLRKGGIGILWTSSLCDHLLMDGKRQLKVFHYASLLRKYGEAGCLERDLYPADVLRETEETLAVLFPTADHGGKGSKRTRKLRDKEGVDIEAQLEVPIYRNLDHYKIWKERLAIVQYTYDKSKPGRPQQWWFDRRNKMEWSTFWVAVVVFFLTLLFGIISSVTGILQVYASFRALH